MSIEAPNNSNFVKHLIELNIAVFLISTSGVLGKYIDLPTPLIIAIRSIFGAIVLFLYGKWNGYSFKIEKKDIKTLIIGGVLFAAHWLTYFYALKLSSVAIGMLSLFTYPVITAILEPLILRTKILKFHLFLGVLILIGVYLLVPEFNTENAHFKAVGFGVLSAFCFSLRNIFMKSIVHKYNGSVLMVNQLVVISVLLSPMFFLLDISQIVNFIPSLLALILLCTSLGHTLFLHSFKNFSTVSASIISCLQPLYGIILGMIFLNEFPGISTIFGGAIILSSVFFESYRVYRLQKVVG